MSTTAQATPAAKHESTGPTYVYVARQPIPTGDGNHRFYGADREAAYSLSPSQSTGSEVFVNRRTNSSTACVTTRLSYSAGAPIKTELNLTADELRELAARMLDAAHDIETSTSGAA